MQKRHSSVTPDNSDLVDLLTDVDDYPTELGFKPIVMRDMELPEGFRFPFHLVNDDNFFENIFSRLPRDIHLKVNCKLVKLHFFTVAEKQICLSCVVKTRQFVSSKRTPCP